MKFKTKLLYLLMCVLSVSAFAQNSFTLTGTVLSGTDNFPIPGANILVAGTTNGTNSDFDGKFSISVTSGDVLEISFVGFTTQRITVTDQTDITVVLQEEQNVLDEVVVIGYGKQKKSHLTGAISKVVNDDLEQVAVSRVDDALIGQVSGVNIQATDGGAGSAPTIRIRGTGSITGDSGPLVVVDGLVMDSDVLSNLDMNDVESFEVLKDAASAAIYGSRGGNGVIMITTKQGKAGKTRFSYTTFTGWKEAHQSDHYHFTVAETAAREMAANGVLSDRTKYKQLLGDNTNWQDVIFDGGVITSHALSARGGNEATKFSTSINYLHDEGVLLTDDFKKYGMNLKLDTKLSDKFEMGTRFSPTYSNTRRFDGSTHDILRQPSWLPVYLDEHSIQFVNRLRDGGKYADAQIGDYAIQRMFDDYDLVNGMPIATGGTDISNTSNTNPAAKVQERERRDKKFKLFGSMYLQWNITEDLNFRTTGSGQYRTTERTRWQGVEAHRNGAANTQSDYENEIYRKLVTDNFFNYAKEFGEHDISAVLGWAAEAEHATWSAIRATGYEFDFVETINNGGLIAAANELEWETALMSYIARVNYAFKDRYLASFSFRRDGHSAFGSDVKYGNFPAGSLGWRMDQEDWLIDSNVVSNLKLRISYGVTGNNNIRIDSYDVTDSNVLQNYYPSIPLLAAVTYNGQTGFNPINIANDDLQWERSIEFNPGVDFGFLNGNITGSLDYYNRKSDQLLLNTPVSWTTGFDKALVNLGEVQNSGLEFELRTRNINHENFEWASTLLMSKNKNELTEFADANGQTQSVDSKRAAEWINLEGLPISSFYGWVVDRDIPLEYINNPYHPIGAEAQDVYVKDLNGDGLIDEEDKAVLGNPYPELVWSLANDFKFQDFDLSFTFQGSHGAEVRNMGDQYIFNHFNSAQDYNTSTTPDQQFIKQKIFTDDIIQDASYVALRNINLGYNFPRELVDKWKMNRLRVYAAGQNLFYWTASDYTGFNPESIDNTSPTTYGYQRAGSPVFSTVSLGLNLEF